MLKRIVNITIGCCLGLYIIAVTMLHIPVVQGALASCVSDAVGNKIGTKVTIGRIDLGFFNRLILDDVRIPDQWGEQLLKASRLSVKINIYALAKGQVDISSIQLFGMRANIYKDTQRKQYNFQFIADSLQSKDKKKEPSALNLQINSFIVRNGQLSFRQHKQHVCNSYKLHTDDIELRDISAHVILNTLTNDSIAVKVKRLAVKEQSGLCISGLSLAANAGRHGMQLRGFSLDMPHTQITKADITASYTTDRNGIIPASLQYTGNILAKNIAPEDFKAIVPALGQIGTRLSLNAEFSGTGSSLRVKSLNIGTSDNSLAVSGDGYVSDMSAARRWNVNIRQLHATSALARAIFNAAGKPTPPMLNDNLFANFRGSAGGNRHDMSMRGTIETPAGNADIVAGRQRDMMSAHISTHNFDVSRIAKDCGIGMVSADVKAKGTSTRHLSVDARVGDIEYKNNTYRNIKADVAIDGNMIAGALGIDDARGQVAVKGKADLSPKGKALDITAEIKNLRPAALGLLTRHKDLAVNANATADVRGHQFSDMTGNIRIADIVFAFGDETVTPRDITITSQDHGQEHSLSLDSDFCTMNLTGLFSYKSLIGSMKNIVAKHIQSLPGTTLTYTKKHNNNFTAYATIHDTHLLKKLTGIDFVAEKPLTLRAMLNDGKEQIDLGIYMPAFSFNGGKYKGLTLAARTTNDTLHADISLKKLMDNNKVCSYVLRANAANNLLGATLHLNDNEEHPIRGVIDTRTSFYKGHDGKPTAHVEFNRSTVNIGDTTWHVLPSSVEYSANDLVVNKFKISHRGQSLTIDGRATKDMADSLNIYLKDIDISYILNLVNFHSVEFSGMATGTATVAALFAGQPKAYANLDVANFRFEDGRMGTLHAGVNLNNEQKQIDISAVATDNYDKDRPERRTIIEGYVSPQRNYINLGITAEHTRIEFMKSFCSSFMDNIEAEADGSVLLSGTLDNINLTGQLVANGSMTIPPLNTTYTMRNDTIRCIPDAILMENDTIYDRNGNIGIVNGKLGHRHLTKLTYDLNIAAQNLLAYDTHTFDGNTFYGTAYMTGDCRISGRSGEVSINVNGTPQKGSTLVYNVASPDAIGTQDFLKWVSMRNDNDTTSIAGKATGNEDRSLASDMKINFLINCTPDATIRLLMDNQSGDYIALNGHGVLKANYFNKGGFDLFGNYTVDTGHYKLTVQNFLKRDFVFRQGSTINFGGDPYAATLNLNAVYSLASVSLADLNIGKSFTSNNTKVDCIMNISGTPASPKVDFSLDIPSISSDARQMVYSLINSEEEMNQQVLYLLAVGRFMTQGRNNAGTEGQNQQSQASLAMQSILSGTIMQQINEVIGNLTSHSSWNFGANISTGTEGWNNAEYEGLLSGSLLSGRLLIDGQFGYRDKANATTSFIGDFDLKYLLYPNGNLAINFYNKTNDRYFTRNSLNTQGIGLLLKKDFTTLADLFGRKNRKNKNNGTAGKPKDNKTNGKAR